MGQENQPKTPAPRAITLSSPAERMYHAWDDALSRNDAAALTALYATDAVIESPLIPHLMGFERAITGHEEIRAFWEKLADRKTPSAEVLPDRLSNQWQEALVGVSSGDTRRRLDGLCRSYGIESRWLDSKISLSIGVGSVLAS
jgi:hypothetical protein